MRTKFYITFFIFFSYSYWRSISMYAHIIVVNCAPYIADLFPYWYGFPFMDKL
jgi:hypothetical protein